MKIATVKHKMLLKARLYYTVTENTLKN